MKIQWIQDFLSLAETGNFSRSADIRATTQPAFSRRIKALEQWLSASLFDRSESPVCLTTAGMQFRPTAEETLRRLYQCKEEISRENSNAVNVISFAATHTLSSNFFPSWLNQIEEQLGILLTRLESDQMAKGMQSLIKGQCHFMLCHSHPHMSLALNPHHYTSVVVGTDRLIPVCAPNEDDSTNLGLPGSAKQALAYLGYYDTSGIGRAVQQLLAENHDELHLNTVFESYLVGVLKKMCGEGRGLAWLPEQQILAELQSGALVIAHDGSRESEKRWSIPIEIRLFRARESLPAKAEQLWSHAQNRVVEPQP